MNKGLIFLLGIISFFGINTVSAKEIYLEFSDEFYQIESDINNIGYENINYAINELINYYNENLINNYPYYYIYFFISGLNNNLIITFNAFTELEYSIHENFWSYSSSLEYRPPTDGNVIELSIEYDKDSNSFLDLETTSGMYSRPILLYFSSEKNEYNPYHYYYSNFDLYYKGSLYTEDVPSFPSLEIDDIFYIPIYKDSSKFSSHKSNQDFIFNPFYLFDGNNSLKDETYVSINLNDYSYVALSLKDYNTIPENNSSVYTNLSVKGQLCITPVYNYGQTERKDILTGTQIQGCSQYYNDFTLTRMYILKDDVENHAIYYLKAYDTSKENFVKVDTSKFYITYITEDKKDNPEVLINGKVYPTLSYGSLTDTSTKSEDEGYVPGASCAVGDFNCYNKYNSENIFDEVFSSPLDFLKNIWSSVTSIFNLITEFISLLPPIMQSFLYLSFMVAVAFGLIKLIL